MKLSAPLKSLRPVAVVLALTSICAASWAEVPSILIKGNTQAVTSADVQADAERIPEAMRQSFLANAKNAQELATNLYVRRVMAERGKQAGLDQLPEVLAAIQIAADKVISDAYLVKFNRDHAPKDNVLEAQAKAAYQAKKETFVSPEQVRASHILIAGDTPESKEKADKLLKELQSGADFATLAKTNSQDPGSAIKGGDLGSFTRGKMVPEFESAVFDLKKAGDLTVVKSTFGYHVVKLDDKQSAKQQTYEEVAPQLKKQAADEMLNKERSIVVQQVTEAMKIDKPAIDAFSKRFEKK